MNVYYRATINCEYKTKSRIFKHQYIFSKALNIERIELNLLCILLAPSKKFIQNSHS